MLSSAGCSTGLHQREIRECRESGFQNNVVLMAVSEAKYKDCLKKKKEMQAAERQMVFIGSMFDFALEILDIKDTD